MSTTHKTHFSKALTLVPLALFVAVASFSIGTRTAGDLRAIQYSSATDDSVRGDLTADGVIDERDVIVMLEIAQGYRTATPAELEADPNNNGVIGVDDAIRILRSMSDR